MTYFRFLSSTTLMLILCLGSFAARAQSVDRAQVEKEIDALWEQVKTREAVLLETPDEDKAAYAKFLEQPDTGLIRLLPREKYDYLHKLPMRGAGSYYSFALRKQEYGGGSDICLENDKFSVGFAGMDYGLLLPVGDLPLDKIDLEYPAVKNLTDYETPPTEVEIRAQARQAYKGIKLGEFVFNNSVDAKAGTTYILRSFDFDRSDLLVAFRAVRRDDDGSFILLWKTIKTFPAPKAIRQPQN